MGAEFKRGQLVTNKSAIKRRLNAIIQNDYASRRSEEDMYRGDWGSSSVRENPIIEFDLKTRTERAWGKRQEVFLDLEFAKYVIDWAIINEEGYTKLKPKLVIAKGVRGPYFIKSDYRVMEFKTQAEIKDLLRS